MNKNKLICMIVSIVSFVLLIVINIATVNSYLNVANGVTSIGSFIGLMDTLSRPMSLVTIATFIWPISLLLQRIDHLNRWVKLALLFAILFASRVLGSLSGLLSSHSFNVNNTPLVGFWISSLLCSNISGALFTTLYAAALRSLGFFANKQHAAEASLQDDHAALPVAAAPHMQPVSELEKYRQQMRNGGM